MEEKQTAYERISGENQVYKNVKEMLREVIGKVKEFAAADLWVPAGTGPFSLDPEKAEAGSMPVLFEEPLQWA